MLLPCGNPGTNIWREQSFLEGTEASVAPSRLTGESQVRHFPSKPTANRTPHASNSNLLITSLEAWSGRQQRTQRSRCPLFDAETSQVLRLQLLEVQPAGLSLELKGFSEMNAVGNWRPPASRPVCSVHRNRSKLHLRKQQIPTTLASRLYSHWLSRYGDLCQSGLTFVLVKRAEGRHGSPEPFRLQGV